jgi:hypothetical protein
MCEFDKNQIPYCNIKNFQKNEISKNFGPLMEHGAHIK